MKNSGEHIKKILISYTTASDEEKTFTYAIQLAQQLNAELYACKVTGIPIPTTAGSMGQATMEPPIYDTVPGDVEKLSPEEMEDLKQKYPGISSVLREVDIVAGDMPTITEAYAQKYDIDLVIVGGMGSSGLAELLFGSTVKETIEQTQVPVLVVPDTIKKIKLPTRIAMGVSAKKIPDAEQIDFLNSLCTNFGARIELINVMINHKEAEAETLQNLSNQLVTAGDPYKIANTDIETGIYEFIEEHNTDLLILVYQERSFFKKLFHSSVTSEMIAHARVPVLII